MSRSPTPSPTSLERDVVMNTPALIASLIILIAAPLGHTADIVIKDDGQKATVTADGEPFTEYRYTGYAKPILYPVYGPGQKAMTRNYPMEKGVDNEASDHPHHKSIWYTHDEVNSIRFWMESGDGKKDSDVGTQHQTSLQIEGNTITCTNDWKNSDGEVVCSDRRTISFDADDNRRIIDYDVTWIASVGDVHIGDTKEGTMAIRTTPTLRLKNDPKRGNHTAGGHGINSEGVKDGEMWGKRAAWVDYWGMVDGVEQGIALFDHPSNPRHPTWWHARHYGLVGANPFGVNHFEGKPDGTGDMLIKSGDTLQFRYRFVFHNGNAESADIAAAYDEYKEQ